MVVFVIKRTVVCLMAIAAFFGSFGSGDWSDRFAGHAFPLIAAEKQEKDTVRVTSFNIRYTDVNGVQVKDRLNIVRRQILEIMPDSLGIQEATPEWMVYLDKKLPLYDWVGVDRDNGGDPRIAGESCPIFYLKIKYKLLDSGYFWLSETPNEPSFGPGAACRRICTWAKLKDKETGGEFVHVNSHFDHISEDARTDGAIILTNYIRTHFEGETIVFTADMNTRSNGEAYGIMTSLLADAQVIADNVKTTGTYHGVAPERHMDDTIDFILCTDDLSVSSFRAVTKGVDGRFTSDHFPIYADLRQHRAKPKSVFG